MKKVPQNSELHNCVCLCNNCNTTSITKPEPSQELQKIYKFLQFGGAPSWFVLQHWANSNTAQGIDQMTTKRQNVFCLVTEKEMGLAWMAALSVLRKNSSFKSSLILGKAIQKWHIFIWVVKMIDAARWKKAFSPSSQTLNSSILTVHGCNKDS